MGFLYSLLLKFLYPTSLLLVLLTIAALARRKRWLRRTSFALALTILMVGGNGWVVEGLIRHLESRVRPPTPLPAADAILVLSGGVLARTPPRPTIEVSEAGDRILYGAELFRQRKAPLVICTGSVGTGGIVARPIADEMAELLGMLGVPPHAIVTEGRSENTREHAVNVCPMLESRRIRSVLLVTSAMHMPRSIGVFRRICPGVEFVPAPTDFRTTWADPGVWYREAVSLIPTPQNLVDFSNAMHEYLGIAYYRVRGWI
jgi:uncharacterized SAM-binding protein YcdF (DUF218 family)